MGSEEGGVRLRVIIPTVIITNITIIHIIITIVVVVLITIVVIVFIVGITIAIIAVVVLWGSYARNGWRRFRVGQEGGLGFPRRTIAIGV